MDGLENDFERKLTPRENDYLFNTANKIEVLKNELGIPDQQWSLAAGYIHSCEEYNDIENEHRRASKKLASAMLKLIAEKEA